MSYSAAQNSISRVRSVSMTQPRIVALIKQITALRLQYGIVLCSTARYRHACLYCVCVALVIEDKVGGEEEGALIAQPAPLDGVIDVQDGL